MFSVSTLIAFSLRCNQMSSVSVICSQSQMQSDILLTTLTDQQAVNDQIRELLALPVQLGGMGVSNPVYI